MSEFSKNLVRRYVEQLINSDRWDDVDRILDENYTFHHSASPNPILGREAFHEYTDRFRSSFPNLHAAIEDIFTDADTVVIRVVWSGTHLSNFQNISPTRRAFSIGGTGIYRVKNRLIVEAWAEFDTLELLHQIAGFRHTDDLPEA